MVPINQGRIKMEENLNPEETDEFFEDIDALGLDDEDY